MRRIWTLVLAALALAAPGCPRSSGPGDYDPEASRKFAAYQPDNDLVYLSAASAKGDSVYVIAASTGELVGRIDGPDRRGWAIDWARRVGYYAVSRAHGATSLHRIDLRSGERRALARDQRVGLPMGVLDEDGPVFAPLALSGDGSGLLVARALADAGLWLGRYDTTTGALTAQVTWPLRERVAGVRLEAIGGDRFVVVAFEMRDGSIIGQQLHVVDAAAKVIGSLDSSELPDATPCSARFVAIDDGWGTICSWRGDRYATALTLDRAFRPVRSVPVTLRSAEQVRAFVPAEGGLGVLTDRARWELVRGTAATLAELTRADGRPFGSAILRPVTAIDGGLVLADMVGMGDASSATLVLIDAARGRVIVERPLERGLLASGFGRDIYALVAPRSMSEAAQLQRYDRATLAPRGQAVVVPARDDTWLVGITLIVPP